MTRFPKLWLRSLTIHRYEQFRDCPRVEFSPDDNLILGLNGSGKTSLLRLLAAVLRWNYDALLGQPFDIEFEQAFDVPPDPSVSITGRVQYQPAPLAAGQPFQGRRVVRSKYEGFEAELCIDHGSGPRGIITVRGEMIHARVESASNDQITAPIGPGIAHAIAVAMASLAADLGGGNLSYTAFDLNDCVDNTFAVRETEADFAQLTEHISYSFSNHFSFGSEDFFEDEERQWLMLLDEVVSRAIERKIDRGYLEPVTYERDAGVGSRRDMRALLAALNAESISFRPKLEKSEGSGEGEHLECKGVEIRVRFASGTEIVDSRLTFGQKRLITIALGALVCGGAPMLVDEIDNGLHPGLLEKILEIISGRQTFIVSHNKLVVDLLDYDSPEDICRTVHICRRNPDGTQSLIALSDDQVQEVFEKIEVGIMSPSEVLLQEGLW